MNTRFLTQNDWMIYRDIKLLSLMENPFAFSDSYEDEIKKSNQDYLNELSEFNLPNESFILGVFNEVNELLGFVKFKRDNRTNARHKSSMHSLYIKSEFRRKGLAKKILDELFQHVTKIKELEQIHLWVLISDNSVVEFYKKFGFESQGTVVKNDLKIKNRYVDAVYMVKYLKEN